MHQYHCICTVNGYMASVPAGEVINAPQNTIFFKNAANVAYAAFLVERVEQFPQAFIDGILLYCCELVDGQFAVIKNLPVGLVIPPSVALPAGWPIPE